MILWLQCTDSSRGGARALDKRAAVIGAHRLRSCDTRAYSPQTFGIFLDQRSNPELASGVLTPYGKWMGKQWKIALIDFIFFGSKITADGDCSHKVKKRHLLLGRKVMTNLDSILKKRDMTLPTKVHLVKAMVFPVVTYGCESWTIKKAEHRRIDVFELWR